MIELEFAQCQKSLGEDNTLNLRENLTQMSLFLGSGILLSATGRHTV